MNEQTALKHLAWRAGYGLTAEQWRQPPSVDDYLDELFSRVEMQDVAVANDDQAPRQMPDDSVVDMRRMDSGSLRELRATWLHLLAFPGGAELREKMALFWHGHFACHTILTGFARRQMQTLRAHSLGSFRDLLLAISRDGAMLQYLNNQQNVKDHPNENFARELMELFTIGRGYYTERDVQEAARAFTGWTTNLDGEFVFREDLHDHGTKTFMGRTGEFGGEDIIDILLDRKETARFVSEKIYACFVNAKPDTGHVDALARHFFASNYDIGNLMRYVFSQEWFYAPENVGSKIKSPVDLVVGLMRLAGVRMVEKQALHRLMTRLGQLLFSPPSVAGWPGHRHWINNATLPLRLNLPDILFSHRSPMGDRAHELAGQFYFSEKKFKDNLAGFDAGELRHFLLNTHYADVSMPRADALTAVKQITGTLEYQMS